MIFFCKIAVYCECLSWKIWQCRLVVTCLQIAYVILTMAEIVTGSFGATVETPFGRSQRDRRCLTNVNYGATSGSREREQVPGGQTIAVLQRR